MFARPTAVRRLTTLTAAVFVVVVAGISAAATSANPVNGSDANGTYLALGDSVAFGYVPPNATSMPIRSSAIRSSSQPIGTACWRPPA
jgi:hypothetical protein